MQIKTSIAGKSDTQVNTKANPSASASQHNATENLSLIEVHSHKRRLCSSANLAMSAPPEALDKLKYIQPSLPKQLKPADVTTQLSTSMSSKTLAGFFAINSQVTQAQHQAKKIFFQKNYQDDTNFEGSDNNPSINDSLESYSNEAAVNQQTAYYEAYDYYASDTAAARINTVLRCYGRQEFAEQFPVSDSEYQSIQNQVKSMQEVAMAAPGPIAATRALVFADSCGMLPNEQVLLSLIDFLQLQDDTGESLANGCILQELGFSSTKPTTDIHGELAHLQDMLRFNIVLEAGVPCIPISEEEGEVNDLILLPNQNFLIVDVQPLAEQQSGKSYQVSLVALAPEEYNK